MSNAELKKLVIRTDDRRFFAILELMRRGIDVNAINKATEIDLFFLNEMENLVRLEATAKQMTVDSVTVDAFIDFKKAGFTNSWLAETWNTTTEKVTAKQRAYGIIPEYHAVQGYTESKEERAEYYYVTWTTEEAAGFDATGEANIDVRAVAINEAAGTDFTEKSSAAVDEEAADTIFTEKAANNKVSSKHFPKSSAEKVLIIGSGPIRIGQGIEFDYCSVQGVQTLQKFGYETVLINNNPATVSTDYELADKLYVEPITAEDVLLVMEHEHITKAIVQFGGQTAISLVKELEAAGVELLGSTMKTIDTLEDRDLFYQYLQSINVPHIPGQIATSHKDLEKKAEEVGFPILIRPSYVIGGKGMAIIETVGALNKYMRRNLNDNSYPILIDAYLPGKEVEVDVVTDGTEIFIPAIFEHVEKAGVHSGDSMAVTPPISLSQQMKEKIVDYAEKVATGINFKGIFNIQFVIYEDTLFVLEVNPRASRTVPVVSKVTGVNMIEHATAALLGKKLLTDTKVLPENNFYTVKAPIFSNVKLPGVDPKLVPEMKSTGEIIAMAPTLEQSFAKAFLWNEELATTFKQEKEREIYIASDDGNFADLKEHFEKIGIKIKYKEDFGADVTFKEIEQWMKSEQAFAIYSTEENSVERERALEFQLLVMTAEETVRAFSSLSTKEQGVIAIQHLELAYQKEVVLQ